MLRWCVCYFGSSLMVKTDIWEHQLKVRKEFPKRLWYPIQSYLLVSQLLQKKVIFSKTKVSSAGTLALLDFLCLCDYPFKMETMETVYIQRIKNIYTNMRWERYGKSSKRLKALVNNKVKLNGITSYMNSIYLFIIRYVILRIKKMIFYLLYSCHMILKKK